MSVVLRITVMPDLASHELYVDHIDERGEELYRLCCECDLEGIVAKRKDGLYHSERRRSSWVKIKNPDYTQQEG
jgi:ATP-dependent DNA ligase